MKEDESNCVQKKINKKKDTKNEAEYEKYSFADEVLSYFKIFKCGKNILNRLDVTYKRLFTTTPRDK